MDLLFYHRFLKALVAFDLKIGPFEPEHAGKMDFYLNLLNDKERARTTALDRHHPLRREGRRGSRVRAQDKTNPIGVAEYQLQPGCPPSSRAGCPRRSNWPTRSRILLAGEMNMAKKSHLSHKTVETLKHDEAKRKNIPTAEYQSVLQKEEEKPKTIKYPRNTDLDPQLVWRGKDEQDWSDLVVHAPPLYIQEKVHPKVLIDDLLRQTREQRDQEAGAQTDLFADFNGIPAGVDKTEFYQHDQNWSNRMILGDSLQVMASLAEREGLRGKVQCIYIDPPYGIKFNSNFQWSTTSRDVKDGNAGHITREPEQVKAFRDTWRDGIHSYLTYLRDRLTVARDLLTDSGSIFVQIGDENVHRVRALMDEVFGENNFVQRSSVSRRLAERDPPNLVGMSLNRYDYDSLVSRNAGDLSSIASFYERSSAMTLTSEMTR